MKTLETRRRLVEMLMRCNNLYIPSSQQRWSSFVSVRTKRTIAHHALKTLAPPRRCVANNLGGGAEGSAATARAQQRPRPALDSTIGPRE